MTPADPDTTITAGRDTLSGPAQDARERAAAAALVEMLSRSRSGHPVCAEDFCSGSDGAADPEQVLDMVYAEYLVRCETGAPPAVSELAARFPHLADRIRRQIEVHEALEGDDGAVAGAAPLSPAAAPVPGAIGRYRVVTQLGEGGQGTVYRGFHPDLGRDVVLKVSRRAVRPGEVDALRAEARALAALDHPGLARVYDFDADAGRPFAVLEFVDGRTLDVVRAADPLAPDRAAGIVAAAADAVGYANGRGVVHRDLKPQNVMVDSADRVRVIDFGLAHLLGDAGTAADGSISGTLLYMAPEQARGESAAFGPHTDVFGLGGILYFLLTGKSPYDGGTKAELLARAARGDWDRARLAGAPVPARLRAVCAKALAPDPGDRYPTAGAFAAALRAAVAPPRRVLFAGVAGAAVLALALAVWGATRKPDKPVPPAPGSQASDQAEPAPPPVPPQPNLQVRVWSERDGRYRDAARALPLATGEKVRFEADAPAGRHLALFAAEPGGEVRALTASPPRAEPGTIGYPLDPGQNAPLTPPKGTVVVLLCGRAGEPVSHDEVRAALGADPWPTLPPRSLLLIEREKVEVFGGRGVGPPEGQPDPEGAALRRLSAARAKLKDRYDVLAGAAFSFK